MSFDKFGDILKKDQEIRVMDSIIKDDSKELKQLKEQNQKLQETIYSLEDKLKEQKENSFVSNESEELKMKEEIIKQLGKENKTLKETNKGLTFELEEINDSLAALNDMWINSKNELKSSNQQIDKLTNLLRECEAKLNNPDKFPFDTIEDFESWIKGALSKASYSFFTTKGKFRPKEIKALFLFLYESWNKLKLGV